jgi:membrane associated rhomboid family serine protease
MSVEPSRQRRSAAGNGTTPPLQAVRQAAGAMIFLIALMWALEVVDTARGGVLDNWGVSPRDPNELPDIFTAPFLHTSFDHLAANTLPLLILGFLTAVRGLGRFIMISFVIVVVSGAGVWLVADANTVHLGASGLVFGYFGYLGARGVLDRRLRDLLIAVVVVLVYGVAVLAGIAPGQRGISWEAHFFGLLGGVLAAWWLRRRPGRPGAADG